MKKVLYLFPVVLLTFALFAFSHQGTSLEGKITDKDTGDPIPFANVTLYQNGKIIAGVQSDFEGNYSFTNYDPGTYGVEASYLGYASTQIKGVKIKAGRVTKVDISLKAQEMLSNDILVVDYSMPLMKSDNTTQGKTMTLKKIKNLPSRKIRTSKTSTLSQVPPKSVSSGRRDSIQDYSSETYDAIIENPFIRPQNAPLSTFSIDVDAAAYSNIRRFLNDGSLPQKDAIRLEEMINYFDYDYPEPTGKHPFEIITEVSDCPWQKGHQLLHVGLQGKHIATDDLPATNLVFLLDVSGSMANQNKLPLLKESLSLLVDNLREKDKVTIVVYAGAAGLVLAPTNGNDKNKIKEALTKLRSGGSTAGGAGIQLAYNMARKSFIQGGNNRVILATDGDFNVGISNDNDLVKLIEKERNSGVFLTVLGFGTGNYQDAKMQKLADKGNGNHAYIDHISEAKKVLVNEFGGTLFTIAKDVKLQLEFNPTKIAGYRLIGYENRLLADEDFNDDTRDAGELGAGHTVTALYELIPVGQSSPFLRDIDELKYQKNKVKQSAMRGDELLTIKLRYKEPTDRKSKLIEKTVLTLREKMTNSSENYRWSAAVAEFGLLLRDSKYKGTSNWKDLIERAKAAKGADVNGYRREMIELIRKARDFSKITTPKK